MGKFILANNDYLYNAVKHIIMDGSTTLKYIIYGVLIFAFVCCLALLATCRWNNRDTYDNDVSTYQGTVINR